MTQTTQRQTNQTDGEPTVRRDRSSTVRVKDSTDTVFLVVKIVLVLFLAGYIWAIFRGDSGLTVDLSAVETALQSDSTVTALTRGDRSSLSQTLGLDGSDYDGYLFYTADDVMDVSELLVVKTDDPEQQQELAEVVDAYLEDLKSSWEHYGTNQYDLLGDAIVLQKGDCFIYAVSEYNEQWEEEILSCVG